MLPSIPCLYVLMRSPEALAITEDAFVFFQLFSPAIPSLAFVMISGLIYTELKSIRAAQLNCLHL